MSVPPYTLTIDGIATDHLRVEAFRGKEEMSSAWVFDLVVTAPTSDEELERTALGQRAILTFNVGKSPRGFHGVIASARLVGARDANEVLQYELRLVPRLWLLKRKKRTRIFQRQRVVDIVTSVLLEAGIASRWQLGREYPAREYCTQYEETDYRFVTRLLAEAGIYFYFPEGPPMDESAFTAAAMAASVASAVGSNAGTAVGALAGSAVGSVVGEVAQAASSVAAAAMPLIPGDTVICGDDSAFYPPIGGDDPALLAAESAAALAPEVGNAIGDAVGGMPGVASAALSGASALAGEAIAAFTGKAAPQLYYLAMLETTTTPLDKVTRFTLRDSVRSNIANYRDYDPQRPLLFLNSNAVSSSPFPPSPLEAAAEAAATAANLASGAAQGPLQDALGGAASTVQSVAGYVGTAAGMAMGLGSTGLETYEHHGPFLFPKWGFANDEAPRILRQKRRRASVAEGVSGCPDLGPGHRFALSDHPAAHVDQPYVVISVEHRGETKPQGDGQAWRVYENSFSCAPASVTYIPPRPKRKSVQVALTATVTGPKGEEIWVDPMGQIKVQFHWDRDGKYDENSSCWIRTMHPWGGTGWGVQFIPRIGMEVVVVFEGGDPDKPMVLGTLYNGTHPAAFTLPGDKTRSGWRTQSSPGGGGFNELSFEDAAGREQIYVHAQRNLDEVIERNHTLLVRNDEFLRIIGSRMDRIEKNLDEHVRGDHASHVEGNRIDATAGNRDDRVSGALTTRIEGTERRAVQGAATLEYADDHTTKAKGSVTMVVGQNDKKRAWTAHVEGNAGLSSVDGFRISSDKEVVIAVGKSTLRISKDSIELSSPGINVKGQSAGASLSDEGLSLSSKGDAQVVVEKKLVLKTQGASLSLDKEVKIDGQQILLNSPDKAKDPPPKDPKPPTKIELTDDQGNPIPHQRFLVQLDDGSEVGGVTDSEGKAELDLPSGGKVVFPGLKEPKSA